MSTIQHVRGAPGSVLLGGEGFQQLDASAHQTIIPARRVPPKGSFSSSSLCGFAVSDLDYSFRLFHDGDGTPIYERRGEAVPENIFISETGA